MTALAVEPTKPIKKTVYEVEETPHGRWMRFKHKNGSMYKEYRSNIEVFDRPLVSIVSGIHPETGKSGYARGIVAVGPKASGVVAVGQFCEGYFCLGQFAFARVIAIAQFAVAPISIGQMSLALAGIGQMGMAFFGIYQAGVVFAGLGQSLFQLANYFAPAF
ncbi:MAG: hypothetical protein AAGA30_18370 [Planctomycetota bacterium]